MNDLENKSKNELNLKDSLGDFNKIGEFSLGVASPLCIGCEHQDLEIHNMYFECVPYSVIYCSYKDICARIAKKLSNN